MHQWLEAIRMAERFRPQVIFTDVKMPVVDGLQLVEALSSEEYNPIFVIISGYDDFQFAQKAMTLGVTDYLLKPVKQEELKKVLDHVRKRLEKTIHISQREIIRSALLVNLPPQNGKTLLSYRYYLVFLICFGHYLDYCSETPYMIDPTGYMDIIFDLLDNALNPNDAHWFYRTNPYNELIVVNSFCDTVPERVLQLPPRLLRELEHVATPVTIAYSKVIQDLSGLGSAYRQLRHSLHQNLLYYASSCIAPFQKSNQQRFDLTQQEERNLIYPLQNGQEGVFLTQLHQFLQNCEKNNCTQQALQKNLVRIVDLCCQYMPKADRYSEDAVSYIAGTVAASKDYHDLRVNLDQFFSYYFSAENERTDSPPREQTLLQIQQYLREHCAEPLSLDYLSSAFHMHPSHLSKIFKEKFRTTPIGYLTQVRMEKACQLLKSPSIKVRDVSEMCGYSDPFYFSKVFKENFGMSPTKYQQEHLPKGDTDNPYSQS